MDIFGDSESGSDQKIKGVVSKVDGHLHCPVDGIRTVLDAHSHKDLLVHFTHTWQLPYWQLSHELCDCLLRTLQVCLSIWLIHVRTNFGEHLIACDTTTCGHPGLFTNFTSDLLSDEKPSHFVVHIVLSEVIRHIKVCFVESHSLNIWVVRSQQFLDFV
jgi:hypothetical protein